jgi:hypothetical protein
MKKAMFLGTFMLSALLWAGAQQPGGMPAQSGPQTTSPGAQAPGAGQAQPGMPGAAGQTAPQADPTANAPVTQGCLGGSNPNYTITDNAGKTYKLVLPPNADGSRLAPHVGESVQVMGDMNQAGGSDSIAVSKIGKGNGTCPGK